MKKKIIFLTWFLLIFSINQFAFGEEDCFLEINNNTKRYWRINIDKICVGVVRPFSGQQIIIKSPNKKFEVELEGISDDRGHSQRRSFWPEDAKENKFIWEVEP